MGLYKGDEKILNSVSVVNEENMRTIAEEVISTNTTLKVYYSSVKIDDLSLVVPANSIDALKNIATYIPSDRKLLSILGCDIWVYANDVIPTVIGNDTLRFKNLSSSNVTLSTIVISYLYTTA